MPEPEARPTLVVFTLGARAERARRPLLGRRLGTAEIGLREACLDAALLAGRAAGLRLAVCSPRPLATAGACETLPQRRGGFGERLAAAMDDAFAHGAGPLVVVGADTPGLEASHLAAALAALAADPAAVVVGPSPDGGLYLIAARRPIPGLAGAARWSSAATLTTLLAALRAAGRPVTLLPPLADLDRPADLAEWLERSAPAGRSLAASRWLAAWREVLARLLADLARPTSSPRSAAPRRGVAAIPEGRAPPLAATTAIAA
jgi:2-phospho-L-lactate guanylyltransferase (CobY/MobA/RfbA family)